MFYFSNSSSISSNLVVLYYNNFNVYFINKLFHNWNVNGGEYNNNYKRKKNIFNNNWD